MGRKRGMLAPKIEVFGTLKAEFQQLRFTFLSPPTAQQQQGLALENEEETSKNPFFPPEEDGASNIVDAMDRE